MTLEALAAGKDVYLEKPMTLTIDEGPEMYGAAEKSGRILQVGSQGISSKLQETAREIIKSGKLGQITLVRATLRPQLRVRRLALPHPPRRRPEDGRLGRVRRAGPEAAVQPRALLPLARLLGLLGRASRPTSSST